jgi:hypothetical protein
MGQGRGIAAESNGLDPTPSIRVALSIEDRQRARSCDVLTITHVDADVDPHTLD